MMSFSRLEEAESRHGRESREQAEVIAQLRREVGEVTETFRGQLQGLQEEQQKVMGSLSSELETTKNSLSRLQQVLRGREREEVSEREREREREGERERGSFSVCSSLSV